MMNPSHTSPLDSSAESELPIDLDGNRRAQKYSGSEQLQRVLWGMGQWLIRLSPRPMFGWRRSVLRCFGAKVGSNVNFYASTRFYMPWNVELQDWAAIGEDALIYSLGKVTIGRGATVSYRAHLCAGTHDFADQKLALLKPPIVIGAQAWVGTDAFIGPGVVVGEGAIVGARAVVMRSVAPLDVVVGNPATVVSRRKPPVST